jgi:hypothetical protein
VVGIPRYHVKGEYGRYLYSREGRVRKITVITYKGEQDICSHVKEDKEDHSNHIKGEGRYLYSREGRVRHIHGIT